VLWQGEINLDHRSARDVGVPDDVDERLLNASSGALLQREVDLCDARGVPLCYAASWWNIRASNEIILDVDAENAFSALDRPVWLKLAEDKTELFREVRRVYRGQSQRLSTAWGLPSDTHFWARHYIFWRAREPLCVIYEVMSPALETYLGPSARIARARGAAAHLASRPRSSRDATRRARSHRASRRARSHRASRV
jgi:chorismate lyase